MADIDTSHLDADTDKVKPARAALLQAVQRVNDLASTASAAKGAGLMGIDLDAGYAADTVGWAIRQAMRVSVLRYIPVSEWDDIAAGISTYDCTAAFDEANATGRGVLAPAGAYNVSDIAVIDGMDIEGEGDGRTGKTTLRVCANNTAAFRHSAAGDRFNVRIANFRIEAAAGVTGAKAYRQDDLTYYLAYARFEAIETSKSLAISYDGFFIFTSWTDCRDGYVGTAPGAQDHYAIKSKPVDTSQSRQTNLCQLLRCQIFGSTSGAPAAVDIEYGGNWRFEATCFEQLLSPAVRSLGVFQGTFQSCWFEAITAASVVILAECPAPNAQGSGTWAFDDCFGALFNVTGQLVLGVGSTAVSFSSNAFLEVPSGVVIASPASIVREFAHTSAISGAGAAGFITDITTPQAYQNMLPIGPTGLGAAKFTNAGFTSIADIASAIGLSDQAVRFTLSNSGNAAYYSLPSKLVSFLRGRVVTLVIQAYGDSTGGEAFAAAVWDSVGSPAYGNQTSVGTKTVVVNSPNLQTTYVALTVSGAATSLDVGAIAGGSASGKVVTVESMRLVLGAINPTAAGLR